MNAGSGGGKSSRGGAAAVRSRLNAAGRNQWEVALIMHDVSELRPLGFMVAVHGEAFYIIAPSRGVGK